MRYAVPLLWIALTPAVIAAGLLSLPRAVRAVQRRRSARGPRPVGPPVEQVAADLRRLLAEHRRVVRSPQLPARARRLAALEGAIGDCARDAARALDLAVPEPPPAGRLPVDALRALLGDLARSGIVLPDLEGFGR